MILAPILLALAARQGLPTTVTYTNNGARLAVILPELSKLTGLKLRASPEVAGRVLVLRLNGAPVGKTLATVARCLLSTWKPINGGRLLYRDATQVAAARKDGIAAYAKVVEAALASIGTKSRRMDMDRGHVSELDRALARMAPAFKARELAQLPDGERIVYSSRPTPLQRRAPTSEMAAMKEYERRQPGYFGPPPENRPGPLDKFDVAVWVHEDQLHFSMMLFDAKGQMIEQRETAYWVGKDWASNPSEPKGATPLKVSRIAKEYLLLADSGPISRTLLYRLRKPLKYDPDSFLGEYLVAYAKTLGRQLVAAPSDALAAGYELGKEVTVESLPLGLPYFGKVDFGNKDGWIKVADAFPRPDDYVGSHRDRGEIASLNVWKYDRDGESLLDLVRADRANMCDFFWYPQARSYPRVRSAIFAAADLIDMLSPMTDAQIKELLAGRRLKLGSMTPAFQKAFREFSESTKGQPGLAESDAGYNQTVLAAERGGYFGMLESPRPPGWKPFRYDDLWREYTEIETSFAPVDVTIQLREVRYPAASIYGDPSREECMPLSEIADYVKLNDVPSTARYRLGTGHSYYLTFQLAPHVSSGVTGETTTFARGSKLMPSKDFPSRLRKEFDFDQGGSQ